jgi:luciferase family oxidoreductase group 1
MKLISILDLCPIVEGGDAAQSFRNMADLAKKAEQWGYHRYWLAEHHSMPGIASSATEILIAHVASHTSSIRVGAGGIMLPNHSPLVVAEQFGTLETLFPGRIDLGLGRAPGSDQMTARALRRTLDTNPDDFPQDVMELMNYFQPQTQGFRPVRAIPGEGLQVPIWILGSSLFGAQVAAELGLPYAFASHFAPGMLMPALEVYRERFKPSAQLDRPYVMLGFNVFAADTDKEGVFLASSVQQSFVALRTGRPTRLKPPVQDYLSQLNPVELSILDQALSCTAMGSPQTVRKKLDAFIAQTGADELMITSHIYDHAARARSLELAAEICRT